MEEAILDYEAALDLDDGKGNELLNTIRSFTGAESVFSMTGKQRMSPMGANGTSFCTDNNSTNLQSSS
jgi:hypothetical protein